MQHVYVANHNTWDELKREQEDPSTSNMSLDDFSAPQLSGVFLEWNQEACAICKRLVVADLEEEFGYTPEVTWVDGQFVKPEIGVENAVYSAFVGDDYVAAMIVQKRVVS